MPNPNRLYFRGFHPDPYGETIIHYLGEDIKGDWLYWNWRGVIQSPTKWSPKPKERNKRYFIEGFDLISDTITQWVAEDGPGADIFDCDIIQDKEKRGPQWIVEYDNFRHCWYMVEFNNPLVSAQFDDEEMKNYEVLSNKWEVTNGDD